MHAYMMKWIMTLAVLTTVGMPAVIKAEEIQETSAPEEIIQEELPEVTEAVPEEIIPEETEQETEVTEPARESAAPAETETPAPSASPEPSAEPSPSASPDPTEIPMPEITEEPEPSPTPEVSAEPTPTPEATPEPSAAPTEVPMPEITETPEPSATPAPQPVNVYRVYNSRSGEHFYTLKVKEKDALVKAGWTYEGIGWVAPDLSDIPVYRLYNSRAGEHHYTINEKEKDALVTKYKWTYEGIGWYSDADETVPLYREFNPRRTKCNHNFTTSKKEHDALIKYGWKDEGIAWYALQEGIPAPTPKPTATPKPSATAKPAAESKTYSYTVTYYAQRDSRWAKKKYGKYYFGNTGCGVTSIAMCLTAVLGKAVRPDTVADYLYSIGSYSTPNHHGTTGKSRIHAAKHWGVQYELLTSMEAMKKALQQGKVISMAVRGQSEFMKNKGSHGLTLHQYKDGKVYVYDPWTKTKNGWYSLEYLWNLRSHVKADLDAGPEIIFAFWK